MVYYVKSTEFADDELYNGLADGFLVPCQKAQSPNDTRWVAVLEPGDTLEDINASLPTGSLQSVDPNAGAVEFKFGSSAIKAAQ